MRMRYLLGAVSGAMVATGVAGIAWAGIPGAGGVINGCYQKVEGQLRVIDPGADSCRPAEIPIVWNQLGGKGEPGEAGRDGADGRDGIDVTVEPEPPGANCPTGGARVTGASGVTIVCNALPPDPGKDG